MTELETMQRAKAYIDKMSEGINPITDDSVSPDDVINQRKISNCLKYVSSIISQSILREEDRLRRYAKKSPFRVSQRRLSHYSFEKEPITLKEFVDKINSFIDEKTVEKLKITAVMNWLLENEFLHEHLTLKGKKMKLPTEKGRSVGISVVKKTDVPGEFAAVVYNETAQKLLLTNMAILTEKTNSAYYKHREKIKENF